MLDWSRDIQLEVKGWSWEFMKLQYCIMNCFILVHIKCHFNPSSTSLVHVIMHLQILSLPPTHLTCNYHKSILSLSLYLPLLLPLVNPILLIYNYNWHNPNYGRKYLCLHCMTQRGWERVAAHTTERTLQDPEWGPSNPLGQLRIVTAKDKEVRGNEWHNVHNVFALCLVEMSVSYKTVAAVTVKLCCPSADFEY